MSRRGSFFPVLLIAAALLAGCTRTADVTALPPGSHVTIVTHDGVRVQGHVMEVRPELIVLTNDRASPTLIARAEIASVKVTPLPDSPDGRVPTGPANGAVGTNGVATTGRPYEDVTIPAGTVLPLILRSGIASDASQVEDKITAHLRDDVTINGVPVIREGSVVLGSVTEARSSEKIEGRARVAVRFHTLKPAGGSEHYTIRTGAVARQAPETGADHAPRTVVPASAGAIIRSMAEGSESGATGGSGPGTTVVLTTRGEEVRLRPGQAIAVKLQRPVTVRVP